MSYHYYFNVLHLRIWEGSDQGVLLPFGGLPTLHQGQNNAYLLHLLWLCHYSSQCLALHRYHCGCRGPFLLELVTPVQSCDSSHELRHAYPGPTYPQGSISPLLMFGPKPLDSSLQLTHWLTVLFFLSDYFVSGIDWVLQMECSLLQECLVNLCHFNLLWEELSAPIVCSFIFHVTSGYLRQNMLLFSCSGIRKIKHSVVRA